MGFSLSNSIIDASESTMGNHQLGDGTVYCVHVGELSELLGHFSIQKYKTNKHKNTQQNTS